MLRRSGEPAVAGAGDLDAELGAVARHHRRPPSSPGRRGRRPWRSLHAGMPRLRKKWSLPPMNRTARGDVRLRGVRRRSIAGQQLAQEHQRPGAVAVVPLVAHLQHLRDDRLDVDAAARVDAPARTACQQRARARRPSTRSRSSTSGAVGAVAQDLAQALVQRCTTRAPPCTGSSSTEHPHRRADHPGHRPDRARGGGTAPRATAPGRARLGVLGVGGETLEHHRAR